MSAESASQIVRIAPTSGLPAGGHYSHGIGYAGLVFVSGQLPIVPGSTERTVGTIEEQTRQTLANVESVLIAGGSNLAHLLSVTVYVSDMSLWSRVNATYAEIMGDNLPTRAIVPVGELHYGYQIEIQAIGAQRTSR